MPRSTPKPATEGGRRTKPAGRAGAKTKPAGRAGAKTKPAGQAGAKKVTLAFSQQQLELLDRLKAEKRWGESREEIVLAVFRDYVKQELGE